jgi:hypothetical protein
VKIGGPGDGMPCYPLLFIVVEQEKRAPLYILPENFVYYWSLQSTKIVVQPSFQCNRRAIKLPKGMKKFSKELYMYFIIYSTNISNFKFYVNIYKEVKIILFLNHSY